MRVWRVAHETYNLYDGFPAGPYITKYLPVEVISATDDMAHSHNDSRHPCPDWDSELNEIREAESCGFASREALFEWFEAEWHDMLQSAGFRVYEYEIPDDKVRVGRVGQALFERSAAGEPVSVTDVRV